MEQGTGKTKLTIDRSASMFLRRKIDLTVIICPNSLMDTWCEEIETHCSVPFVYAKWDPDLKRKSVVELEKITQCPKDKLGFFIINIEAIRTKKGAKMCHWLARHYRIHLAVDESSRIKTPKAQQTVAAINLARLSVARTILSGTPIDKSAAEYYSQLEFLTPNPLGFSNFFSFRARYCELATVMMPIHGKKDKNGKPKKRKVTLIKGPKNTQELMEKLNEFCFFVKKKDCLDLPDKIYHTRHAELSKQQRLLYKQIKEQIVTDLGEGRELTVEFHLARMVRLQQLTGGFLPSDDDANAKPVPGPNPKIELLLETIEEFPGPTIIWARFQAEHRAIHKALTSIMKPERIGFITGPTDPEDREAYRIAFQSPDNPLDYLICTQQCAGYGYTLTRAENEIYYSNTFSLEHRLQSEDRAHRIGQTKNVNYIDLIVKGTPDTIIHKALLSKKNVSEMLTDINYAWY